jgi:catechol 2,3-dioxygenase-like lactoylglutathione lyase family enzyme
VLDSITISHVFVFDQDEALDFYVGKLGLEVEEDFDLGFMRWLTVCVPGDRSRRILLEKAAPPSVDEQSAAQIRELVSKGATGLTVGFTTPDCRATCEELKAKGVEIREEPVERFYGIDMGIRDPFGNAIRIVELKERA